MSPRNRAAYHEAGHAVMAHHCGLSVDEVTINPVRIAELDGGHLSPLSRVADRCYQERIAGENSQNADHPGRVLYSPPPIPSNGLIHQAEAEAMTMLAGRLSEDRYRRLRGEAVSDDFDLGQWLNSSASSDVAHAIRTLSYCNEGCLTTYLTNIAQRTQHRLAHPRIWQAVTALAACLIVTDTVKNPDLHRLIQGATI